MSEDTRIAKLEASGRRMGWGFPWVSSFRSSLNRDFGVTVTPEDRAPGTARYNFAPTEHTGPEFPGLSVFTRDAQGAVFHTYSCYARDLEALNPTYQLLDLVPKGRDEADLAWPMAWVCHKNRYTG